MKDESVAQVVALLRRHDLPQLSLYFGRLLDPVHKTDQIAEPDTVSVCDDGRFSKYVAHDQIGAFSPNAGQSQKFLE